MYSDKNSAGNKEISYMVACLGQQLFPDRPSPPVPADLDWGRLFNLLKWHHLAAYFYTLRPILGASWPEEFFQGLGDIRKIYILYNGQFTGHIAQVLSRLRNAGVNVIVLKGWAYIQTIYGGDYSIRFCQDIDILVHPQDSAKTAALLSDLAYQPLDESWPGYARRFMNAQQYCLFNQPNVLNLDFAIGFHWGLFHTPFYDPNQVDMDALFSRTRSLSVAGVEVLELSSEDQIVYACAHLGLHHKYDNALNNYYEIGVLIRLTGADLDWQAVIQRAQAWQCVIPLQRSLAFLESLWPGLIPPVVLEEISSIRPVFLERFVNWWFEKTRGGQAYDHLLTWITTPGLKRRFAIAFQDIFPSLKYMQKRYGPAPAGHWPLLYFRRFSRAFLQMRR